MDFQQNNSKFQLNHWTFKKSQGFGQQSSQFQQQQSSNRNQQQQQYVQFNDEDNNNIDEYNTDKMVLNNNNNNNNNNSSNRNQQWLNGQRQNISLKPNNDNNFQQNQTELQLQNPQTTIAQKTLPRKNVLVSQSIESMIICDEGVKMHLIIWFNYDKNAMEYFVPQQKIPGNDIIHKKEYNTSERYFPYIIHNSIEENNLSYTYQWDQISNKVSEKFEIVVVLTISELKRFYPWEISILSIKLGTDGSMHSDLLNLIPATNDKGELDIDYSIFLKKTSLYRLDEDNIEANIFVNTVVRSAKNRRMGSTVDQNGNYTRLYSCFMFQPPWFENLVKFIIFTNSLLLLTVYTSTLDMADLLSVNITIILTDVAILFVLPETRFEFTATEKLLSFQGLLMVFITILCAEGYITGFEQLKWIIGFIFFTTIVYLAYTYKQFRILLSNLNHTFKTHGIQQTVSEDDEVDLNKFTQLSVIDQLI